MLNWKKVNYLRQGESFNYDYVLELPEPLASWDVYDYWEKERTQSIRKNLNQDDILFDIGAEHGWLSVAYAKHCKVFLIEPTQEFWPNIKQTWERNIKEQPVGCFAGLIGDVTNTDIKDFGWPEAVNGELIDKNKYEYIHQHTQGIKQITLDDLIERSVKPTAITIDTEGSELVVLKSGEKYIKENHPKIWVSIHPDLMEKDYGTTKEELLDWMEDMGYKGQHLATDHESHFYFP